MISGNMVGSYSQMGKTFILVDEDGNEITGVCVDNPVVFTAGDNDVREGMVYASDDGVSTGTKNIPAYRTTRGYQAIPPKSKFSIPLAKYNTYDYTQLQCMIAPLNTTINDSYAVNKIVINNGVYNVESTDKVSDVTKNADTLSIDLNIVNNDSKVNFIYYFTYKEEL